jgi:hypothetical protein
MSEKALPPRAIYGWDGTNWVKVLVDVDGKVYITNTDLSTILSEVQNATYGLEALKDLLFAVTGYLDTEIADIKTKTDALPSDPADQSLLEAAITAAHSATETKIERKITHMDFWADNVAQVILTTVGTADYALSALTVAGIPTGATLVRVVAMLKIAVIRDTSGSNNAVNVAAALKVDADVAYGSLVTAIDIPDDSWAVLVANGLDRGGDVMIGDNDVKTEISGNGTYYARLENIACDGNNLKLEDVAWGVRVYFY